MKVQLFTPEIIHGPRGSFPAEMVRPDDATEDEYLFVEYEAYQDALKRIAELERALRDQQMLVMSP